MCYDLRRLRRKGLISRVEHSHRYTLTSYGLRVALFSTKLYLRILRPSWAALADPTDAIPRPLRALFDALNAHIDSLVIQAKLDPAA